MKSKIVLWATNEKDEKILLAIELLANNDKVNLYTFSEELATEEFYTSMMNTWRNDGEVAFPEGYKTVERQLSMADDLLPETIKVERTDIVNRAKTEWHFAVLSAKMYNVYKSELEDIKDKVANLTSYDSGLWEELKGFWSKIQNQLKERNLLREQGNELRETTDSLFDQLKTLRKSLDDEFRKKSKEHLQTFNTKLAEVEDKIEQGLGLKPIFDKLKNLQKEFKDLDFTKDDRRKLWKRLDSAFKTVKEKKFGTAEGGNTASSGLERVERRYNGLMEAIGKMERSIERDKRDKEYQDKQIASTGSQLEAQLKQAKVLMIQERLDSKQAKLDDMLVTKNDILKRIESEKIREAKRLEKQSIEAAKEEIKAKIALDIEKAEEERSIEAQKLEKAAQDIANSKGKKATQAESGEAPVVTNVTESKKEEKTDVVEEDISTADSVAETVVDTIEDVVEKGTSILKSVMESIEDKVEDMVESLSGKDEEE